MVEWWVLRTGDDWKPEAILKMGIPNYREAMREAHKYADGNHFDKVMIIKLTAKIAFEAKFTQITKLIPKGLEDMVQCPRKE
jgi:hypothetical protein